VVVEGWLTNLEVFNGFVEKLAVEDTIILAGLMYGGE
jgi:hypothetical protein